MKSSILCFVLLSLCAVSPAPLPAMESEGDPTGIEEAVRNYLEGWYQGDAARMEKALHPDLSKTRVQPLPSGRDTLNTVSASAMIEYTRGGFGKTENLAGKKITLEILAVSGNIASVKTTCTDFVDLIHLARVNDEWKIINVLWESNQ